MLVKNDLLEYKQNEISRVVRILWIHPSQPTAFTIDTKDPVAIPELQQLNALEDDLLTKKAVLLSTDPLVRMVNESYLPESHRKIRDRAWEIIQEIVCHEPAVFYSDKRWSLIAKCKTKYKCHHKTIYQYLRRYWQQGQTCNALLPNYHKSGAKGIFRIATGGPKRGRPVKFGVLIGVNVTEDLKKIFRVAVLRYYVADKRFTLRGAYDNMLKEFFCDKSIDPETGTISATPNSRFIEAGFPSFSQFTYWLNQDHDRLDILRKRLKPRVYDKDLRGLIGTSNAHVWGPGARYQIDATIADIYLVSRINRGKIIGRPVLYIVTDVFSRMIVGIYIGLEGPSWVGAMMALANTAADKQAFCKKSGRIIEPHEWPCNHLPAAILGDKGEIEGPTIDTLSKNFHVIVETAAAYRADWKGIVEQRFKLLPAKFKAYTPGYIQTDFRQRGGKDYRLDAVLDLDDFTRIIIECVLYYNNSHEIKGYDKDRDLAGENMATVPLDLWEWGIANRSGRLRTFPEDLVRFSLLPVQDATVTLYGIRVFGVFYTCPRAMEERWFDKARQTGNWTVKVSYDPRNQEEIYLHNEDRQLKYEVCQMTERSRAYKQMSTWEILQQQEDEKHTSANHKQGQQLATINLAANIEQIVKNATKSKPEHDGASAASRTEAIRDNRAAEKEANRYAEAFRLGDSGSQPPSSESNVVTFPVSVQDDYDEPDITEIIASKVKENDED